MWAISSASDRLKSPAVKDECGGDPMSQSMLKLLLDAKARHGIVGRR